MDIKKAGFVGIKPQDNTISKFHSVGVLSLIYFDIVSRQMHYDLPKGKCKHNEDYLTCAKRELEEEVRFVDGGYMTLPNIEEICRYTYAGNAIELHLFPAIVTAVDVQPRREHDEACFVEHPKETSRLFLPEKYHSIDRIILKLKLCQ